MKPCNRSASTHLARTLGLVVGAWLILPSSALSAGVPGDGAASPAGDPIAASEPKRPDLAQADAAPVERPVSFSSEQADRGKEKYQSECEECHGDDLRGGLNGGAPVRGVAFEQKYAQGAPASWLFEFVSTAMPPNAPGRFSPDVYADLMAYILKQNGFQPGAPLPTDLDALDALLMEK